MINLNDLQNAICDMVDIQKGVPENGSGKNQLKAILL